MLARLRDNLTLQVLVGMALGVLVGWAAPSLAQQTGVLSDVFIRLVKMVIGPIVFVTLTTGLSGAGSMREVGSLGLKALIYFEVITTLALALGVATTLALAPGAAFDTSQASPTAYMAAPHVLAAPSAVAPSVGPAHTGWQNTLIKLVPDSAVGALAGTDMLPILVFALLFGLSIARTRDKAPKVVRMLDQLGVVFFDIIALVMRLSPLAAFGAVAYAVGHFGVGSLVALGRLLFVVYLSMVLFIVGVLGTVCWLSGFSLWNLLVALRREIVLVLGTSSSESAMPGLMERLGEIGCPKSIVGLVVPTGYSFNLDGTSIYLSCAALFVAQAFHVELSWAQLGWILGILMLTSKGAAGVTGSGFVTLAATLTALPGQPIPLEGLTLLVGIDRFMSAARSLTNLIGNSVATVVLAKLTGQFEDRGIV